MRCRSILAVLLVTVGSIPVAAALEEGHPIEAQLCTSWTLEPVDLPRSPGSPTLSVVNGLFFLSDYFLDDGNDPPFSLLVSEDLQNWEVVEIPVQQIPRIDIAGGNGVFVGFTYDEDYVISHDGYTWDARPIPGGTPYRVFWTGEEFMMVSEGGAFFSSPDGETWDRAGTAPVNQFLSRVATSGREWVVTDLDDRLISSDLEHWTRVEWSEHDLVWGNRRYLVHSTASAIELTDDGDRTPYPVFTAYSEIIGDDDVFTMQTNNQFVGDRFIFVALGTYDNRAYFRFYSSEDGLNWFQQPLELLERDLPVFVTVEDDIVRFGRNLMVLVPIRNPASGEYENFFLKGDCPEISGVTVIPGAAHTGGVGGSLWRTDLTLESRAPGEDEVLLEFLPWNRGVSQMMQRWIRVRGGRATVFEDVVGELFGYEGAGTLWIWPQSGALAVSSRTWEEVHHNGQGPPHLDWSDSLKTNERAILTGLTQNAEFRTNVGLVNLEEIPIDVTLTLRGDEGIELGSVQQHLRARESVQLNGVLEAWAAGPVAAGSAEVRTTTENARLLAYASRIDNASQDPVWIEPSAKVPPLPEGFE